MQKTKLSQLENYFQERLLNKDKLLKIKLNSIDKSPNLNTISHFNSRNSNSKRKKLKIKSNYNYNYTIARRNNESNMPKRIFAYTRNNKVYKYNYNSPELKNDLKRYTNNSLTFRLFNELNKPYLPYAVDAIKKSVLFKVKNNKEKKDRNNKILHINSLKSLLYNNKGFSSTINKSQKLYLKNNDEYFSKKKITKIFEEIQPNELQRILNYNNIEKDLELRDMIDVNFFEDDKLKKKIKKSLLNDINQGETNYKLFYNYLKPINHRINYHEDIYRIPHIRNKLGFKPFKNIEIYQKFLDNRSRNLLHEKVALSMNKMFIIQEILKEQKELKIKKMIERGEYKLKKKWSHIDESFELKFSEFEKNFQHFELTDYFEKYNNYPIIDFASKKLKNAIFTKTF